ncbi:MFS transporter [Xylanibacillus composti]|uniref:MFS transporter n=1 Tax=Xylanibacillus composti TaxID=1572762 RepID=A0A8J4H2P7_9BACL|nr:MDR family MFS transporter [Xylanibacillus composti]MDT9723419.1 MFS transporter [Xylanibacillus composti]GIQ68545.1 MFS transporter [Xylanibacillus composti]
MQHLDRRKKLTILGAMMAAMLFAALNQTIVGTALPKIVADLGGMEYYSWIFTVYMLAATVTTVLVGKLSDIYGRKPFVVIGIAVFIIGSFLCGLAQDIIQLILYRGIQGLGGGVIMATAFTVVGDLFAPRERGRWQGAMAATFGLASVFGPTLGGYIVDHTDWHWIFWVFLPFGFVALALILFLFPSVAKREGESVDYAGSAWLTILIVQLLLAFSWAGEKYAWSSPVIIGLFVGSAISLALFLWAEKAARNPVLPLGLFRDSVFTLSNIIGFLMGAGMFGAIMYMPYFVQGVLGTSATISGYVMMPLTLSMVVASSLSGQLISRTGKYKVLALVGLLIMVAGMLLLYTMDRSSTNWTAIWFNMVVGIGLGIAFPIFTLTVQNAVPDRELGVATSSAQLFRQLGGTIGVSIMGTILTNRMNTRMAELMAASSEGAGSAMPSEAAGESLAEVANPQILMDPDKMAAARQSLAPELHGLFEQMVELLREAMSYALSGVFLFGAVLVALAFVLTFLLKEIPLRTANKQPSSSEEDGDKQLRPPLKTEG